MVIAKTEESMENLVSDFKERNIIKKYVCIVRGEVKEDSFTIKLPIARDLKNRYKMCISKDGKEDWTINRKNTSNKSTYGIFRISNNRW